MEHLFDKLQEYSKSDMYPYHMPGHKRRACGNLPEEMYRLDITEIDGFDNLHQPEEILKDLQEKAAELYGAEESFYLINGSTAGILSAVSSAIPPGGHLLMTRNCHKSVYHAAYLRNLTVSYLYPGKLEEYDILGEVTPQQVKEALDREPDIQAVLIVSPTYEGRISDVRKIADLVHERGIPLIVDEAHGAHLGFSEEFAENSCKAGADLVIHSVHKTLPSCTQTALLHRNGNRIDRERLLRFLHIYQSSSPSYLLMASIDNALQYVEKEGSIAFPAFAARYRKMLDRLTGCKKLHFLSPDKEDADRKRQDIGKLLISTKNTAISGKQLYELLLEKYHLQLEMAGESYALAMFTVNDAPEGYERMEQALLEIDEMLENVEKDTTDRTEQDRSSNPEGSTQEDIEETEENVKESTTKSRGELPAIPLSQAWDMPTGKVKLCDSIGSYSGEFVNLYPPGIPLLVPGEPIEEQLAADIRQYVAEGLNVQGITQKGEELWIDVIGKKEDQSYKRESEVQNSKYKRMEIRMTTTESRKNEKKVENSMRKTKIICTIGPASESEERLKELMLAGMNVARFNFSHGSHEEQKIKYERVLKVRKELGLPVATLLDTKGPEIRLRDFENGKVELVPGQQFVLTTEEILGTAEKASISYKNLKNDINVGTTILIDDGLIEMKVEEISGEEIICRVINGGFISNHKGLNVPGAILSMPYISEVDRNDILFGIEMNFEFLAASFARCKEDILEVRKILDEHGSDMKIIAKIENMQGIQNLEEILEVSDGIMVARGDMGVEIPLEEVPVLQKKMIKLANAQGKHVITATQMLESMIKNPRPTRAEATDVANAIYDGTTAIMLSGESAAGLYPAEAVKTMARIAVSAENNIDYRSRMRRIDNCDKKEITRALAYATCTAAMDLEAAAIITVTLSGFTAESISRFKPSCQIIGCTVDEKVCRQLNLLWGVSPLLIGTKETSEELFMEAVSEAKKAGYVKTGDTVVITAGVPLGVKGKTNMIRVIEVE